MLIPNHTTILPMKRRLCLWLGILSIGIPATPLWANNGGCPSPPIPHNVSGAISPVIGDPLELSRYDGIQALILTNATSRNQSVSLSESLVVEFGKNPRLRQIVLLDGTGLSLVKDLVISEIKKSVPEDPSLLSKHVAVAADFDGDVVTPLQTVAQKVLPQLNIRKQAALLLLDGDGKVISGYSNLAEENLAIRQCIRQFI
ncbi:MAG: hypothetical protein NW237_06470 [Cyanobacteriota bacterium]|nr:hypothetical protein [Cyanobacteriota bacterium]